MWLEKYGTLDNIINHASEITGKVGENLRAHLDDLALSRKLVTIDCDVKLEHTLNELTLQKPDQEKCRELFTKLEFTKWAQEFQDTNVQPKVQSESHYH